MTLPPESVQNLLKQLEHENPSERTAALRHLGGLLEKRSEHHIHIAPLLVKRITRETDARVHEQLINTILANVRRLRNNQDWALFDHYQKGIRILKDAFSKLTGETRRFERQSAIATVLGEMATPESIKALFELGKKPNDFKDGSEPLSFGVQQASNTISQMSYQEKTKIERFDPRYPFVLAGHLKSPRLYRLFDACQDRKKTESQLAEFAAELIKEQRGY